MTKVEAKKKSNLAQEVKKIVAPVAVAAAVSAGSAQAQSKIFLEIDGIEGEATADEYKNQIDVLAWSWGLSFSGTTHIGGGSEAGKSSVSDLSITKFVDAATSQLTLSVLTGQEIKSASIAVTNVGADGKLVEYLSLDMENVLITSQSTGGSTGEDRLTENISLNFSSLCLQYTRFDEKGGKQVEDPVCWDIAKNAPG